MELSVNLEHDSTKHAFTIRISLVQLIFYQSALFVRLVVIVLPIAVSKENVLSIRLGQIEDASHRRNRNLRIAPVITIVKRIFVSTINVCIIHRHHD